jgi:hypothetical protein
LAFETVAIDDENSSDILALVLGVDKSTGARRETLDCDSDSGSKV